MSVSPSRFLANRLKLGNVVCFTGAGLSTASGLPDFRSANTGLWGKYDPMRLASVQAMENHYSEFKSFYQHRIESLLTAAPNQAHFLIAEWEQKGFVSGVITQNVDGFHKTAGSQTLATLHGSLTAIRCSACSLEASVHDFMGNRECRCGGRLRPGVVLFGEGLPVDATELAEKLTEAARTFVVLGSSLLVSPACFYPQIAHDRGASLVIVNREPTPLDSLANLVVRDPIVDYLEAVQKELTAG
jgi:NAD-dependent deacetylase